MRKMLIAVAVLSCVIILTSSASASVLFSDDFTGTTINSSKWTAETGYGSVSQNNEAIFTILGNGAANSGVHLKSSTFTVPTGASEFIFSGVWRVAGSTYTAEPDIYIYNAEDTTKFVRVGYGTWVDALSFIDTTLGGSIANYSRTEHLTNLPFAFHFTESGWTYEENGTVLRNITSNFTNGVNNYFIKIGGWDYSVIPSQIAYFDNINIEASTVPEPATMLLLGLGLMGLAGVRRKFKK